MASKTENIDLLDPFWSWDCSEKFLQQMTECVAGVDAAVTVLALEGLCRIEADMQRGQLTHNKSLQEIIQDWVTNSEHAVAAVLPYLSIFKRWNIQLSLGQDDIEDTQNLDFAQAFVNSESCETFLKSFLVELEKITDPTITVLALEGLYRLEADVLGQSEIHSLPVTNESHFVRSMQSSLRKWRQNCHSGGAYECFNHVKRLLRCLTIFKSLDVPLFIDNYGDLKLLTSFSDFQLSPIVIDRDTPIAHVTHRKEAEAIKNSELFIPSDNKNSVKGLWFGLVREESVYGTQAFITTLEQLRVTGLRQGEIVYYKKERNVILYATDDSEQGFDGLVIPNREVIKESDGEYAHFSIFVPARFLPSKEEFWNVVNEVREVSHRTICVPTLRGRYTDGCPDRY